MPTTTKTLNQISEIKPFILLAVLFFHITTVFCQGIQKVVEINADQKSVHTTMPYNQNILFRFKSKQHDLSKTIYVMILEHRGKKNALESMNSYNTDKSLQKHFYDLDQNYNSKDSVLEVYLRKNPLKDFSDLEEPPYVLFPSKQYSLLISQPRDLKPHEESLVQLVMKYIHDSVSSAPTLDASRKNAYDQLGIVKVKTEKESGFIDEKLLSLESFTKEYSANVYQLDQQLITEKQTWNSYVSNTISFNPITADTELDILLKTLRDTANKCLKKFQCDAHTCKLYESIKALKYLKDNTKLDELLKGKYSLTDLENMFFDAKDPLSLSERLAYLDSTRKYALAVKTLLENILLDNSDIERDGTLYNHFTCCFPKAIYDLFKGYIISLESFVKQVDVSRKYISDIFSTTKKIATFYAKGTLFSKMMIVSADTYVYSFETRSNYSIIPVFGYAVYGFQKDFTSFVPYTGLIFGFQHLDEEIPFRLLKKKRIWQRISFTTAVTLASIKEAGKRDDFFSNSSSFMTAFGFKFSHVVTFNVGALWFKREDPNPFITTKKISATPYVSLSINLKLKKLFEGFTNLIPLK